jgi:hypothetical protein
MVIVPLQKLPLKAANGRRVGGSIVWRGPLVQVSRLLLEGYGRLSVVPVG